MSHVWGQTLPSNYGRLNPSSQREYNTVVDDIVGGGAQAGVEKAIKETATTIQAKVGKELVTTIGTEVGEELETKVTNRMIRKAAAKTAKELPEGAGPEVMEKLFRKNLKEFAQAPIDKATAKSVKKAMKELPESSLDKFGKRVIGAGVLGVTAVVMFNDFLDSDALDSWVKSSTGQDCDEKAEAADLEPGTPEFTERVTTCQEAAADRLGMIGKVITYGGIAVGGLVAVSILSKIGLFSSSKE